MTDETKFKDFVLRQQRSAPTEETIDWEKQKTEWQTYLQQLYDKIGEYLLDYIKEGTIRLSWSKEEINEEYIGTYHVDRLTIHIGLQEINLKPIGTNLIGSKGRVDIVGSSGSSRLVLIDKDISNARSMFRISVRIVGEGETPASEEEAQSVQKQIEWTWKIVSAPPDVSFFELTRESFLSLLLEVSGG
jgi:hypothetical protein